MFCSLFNCRLATLLNLCWYCCSNSSGLVAKSFRDFRKWVFFGLGAIWLELVFEVVMMFNGWYGANVVDGQLLVVVGAAYCVGTL